ncbi:MAG: serine hydrolase domain-containing protein [Myxococcota bacterium]|nr:serine hydrolase domain-containing protein [Myxococcota bacterium]
MILWSWFACSPQGKPHIEGTDTTVVWERPEEFEAVAAQIESDLTSLGSPNAAFAFFQNGEIVYAEGFGGETSPESLFRVASITKSMTAAALLQQKDQGNVNLSTKLVDIDNTLRSVKSPQRLPEVDVESLLNHSAGMVDYLELSCDADLSAFAHGTFAEELYIIAPPGVIWNYSNLNYIMAGYAIEALSGVEYAQYMQENVFAPLGMNRTVFAPSAVLEDGMWATGEHLGEEIVPDSYDCPFTRPAGFAWSSVLDMSLWGMFLLEGNTAVLSETSRQDMMVSQISMGLWDDLLTYSYGLMQYAGFNSEAGWHDMPFVYHKGSINGYGSEMYLFPEHNAGFVVLIGTSGGSLPNANFAAIDYLGIPEAVSVPENLYPESDLTPYEGIYFDNWNVQDIFISAGEGALSVEMPHLDSMGVPYDEEWLPYTKDNFMGNIDGYDLVIRIAPDESGIMQYVINRAFVGLRSGDLPQSLQQTASRPSFAPTPLSANPLGLWKP